MFLVNWIIKYISQRIFRENQWNKFGFEDPYYEEYEIEQRSFFTGSPTLKKLKKRKEIPAGLSEHDSSILKKVIRRAYHLDMLFNVFGYRVGWSGLIGLVPVAGDFASVVFSLLLFKTAREIEGGLPWLLQLQILGNILIDFLIGLVPVVGDVIEVLYKANSRNALLLEKHLQEKAFSIKEANTSALSDVSTVVDDDLSDAAIVTGASRVAPSKVKSQPEKLGNTGFSGHQQYQIGAGAEPGAIHARNLSR